MLRSILRCLLSALLLAAAAPALAQTVPPGEPTGSPPPVAAPAADPRASAPADAAGTGQDIQPLPDGATPPRLEARPTIPEALLPHDLSPWGMFMAADIVVQAVMVGLALASLVTWTIWLAKSLELGGARRRAAAAYTTVDAARSLGEAVQQVQRQRGTAAALVRIAALEVEASVDVPGPGVEKRVTSRLERVESAASRRIGRGTGILATIGATAPFIGLFGTVWGIMNSFIGISRAQTTNLAIVAPGIAEALLATALGLVAAIPAVVIYNAFARRTAAYRAILRDISAAIERLVSRDLDRQAGHRLRAAE